METHASKNYDYHSEDELRRVASEQEELTFLRKALKQLILHEESATKNPPRSTAEEESHYGRDRGIPNHIEVRKECLHHNPILSYDHSSELTPSEGDFPEAFHPPLQSQRLLSNRNLLPLESSGQETVQPSFSYPDLEKGQVKGHHARCLDFFMYMNDTQKLVRGKYSGRISLDTGLPHGKGVFRSENGDFYVGDFLNGMMHGDGCLFTRRNEKLLKLRGSFQNNDYYGDSSLLNDTKDGLNVSI
ncbi:MAG: hypothetical protein SGILL_009127 [Bacillariaceae sp.]